MQRRLTRREKNKRNKQIIMVSTVCILFIMVVGYAAFQTNLTLKAKGNIKSKKAADMLKENIVDSGDGLYKDIYEDGKYTYKGANPNNYITFNNEAWRIISIDADNTIKIMQNESIGQMAWDTSTGCPVAYNDVIKKSNQTIVNNIIYLAPDPGLSGCNIWSIPASLNTYLNNDYLNSIDVNNDKIVSHTWSVGRIINNNSDLAEQINNEKDTTWFGNVGLITISEYIKANSNIEQCGDLKMTNQNGNICLTTNWMAKSSWNWSITTVNSSNNLVFVFANQYLSTATAGTNGGETGYVTPVLYLSSDITLSGQGTENNPYIITN